MYVCTYVCLCVCVCVFVCVCVCVYVCVRVKLSCFILSCATSLHVLHLTSDGYLTVSTGCNVYSSSVDLWSVGCILAGKMIYDSFNKKKSTFKNIFSYFLLYPVFVF